MQFIVEASRACSNSEQPTCAAYDRNTTTAALRCSTKVPLSQMQADNSFTDIQFMVDEMETDEITSNVLFDSSSSDEEEGKSNRTGKSPNKERNFAMAYQHQIAFYFSGRESIYSKSDFERRFRCPRTVWNRIYDAMMGKDPFVHYVDASKKPGIYPLVKLVACFRYLAYGDALD